MIKQSKQAGEMTCESGHALELLEEPFARYEQGDFMSGGFSTYCDYCYRWIVPKAGYYRCLEQKCDWDACRECIASTRSHKEKKVTIPCLNLLSVFNDGATAAPGNTEQRPDRTE